MRCTLQTVLQEKLGVDYNIHLIALLYRILYTRWKIYCIENTNEVKLIDETGCTNLRARLVPSMSKELIMEFVKVLTGQNRMFKSM